MRSFLIAAAFAVAASTVSASSYIAENRLQVVALNASDFEVIEARGAGPRGIWCAAASYGLNSKRLPGVQRIYVKSPRGASVSGAGRIGVVFTADPSRLSQPPSRSVSVSTRTVGQGLTLAHAVQFCRDQLIEPDDVFLKLRRP